MKTMNQKKLKKNKQSESTIDYHIDSSLNLNQEGYKLNVLKNKISIVAKDEAGLFYAFTTLDQLIEDSKDQNVNLPMLSIEDYPLIKFRPIHIDVKHHLEKESYYYQLMDHLAQLKINGVILEIEDKLKYKRQNLVVDIISGIQKMVVTCIEIEFLHGCFI